MTPRVNDKGGKSVSLISTQTNKSLHLNTPLLMTWGIADFANDDGSSDGKFKITLNFPNAEYTSADTNAFLEKMSAFQAQVIDDAVANSDLWFGKKKSRELVEDSFFPFLKYPKLKDPATNKPTGAIDYSRPPSISAKVPRFENSDGTTRWECDLFDTNYNMIFPTDESDITPVDLVPKLSKIACTLQCSGIWVGGKGWGLTWKFISGVVKPKISEVVRGVCHVKISDSDLKELDSQDAAPAAAVPQEPSPKKEPVQTIVDDSDDEKDTEVEPVQEAAQVEVQPVVEEPKPVVKKVVKKKVVSSA